MFENWEKPFYPSPPQTIFPKHLFKDSEAAPMATFHFEYSQCWLLQERHCSVKSGEHEALFEHSQPHGYLHVLSRIWPGKERFNSPAFMKHLKTFSSSLECGCGVDRR